MFEEILPHDPLQPPFLLTFIACRRQRADHFAVVLEFKTHVETRQRQFSEQLIDVIELGALGPQELSPRGDIVKQVFDTDARARLDCIRFRFRQFPPADLD